MALVKQNVAVSFEQGIDTKSDPKQLILGKLTTLENATFTSPKRFKKRNGFSSLLNSITGTANKILAGVGLKTFKSELVQLDGNTVYSRSTETNSWTNKGAAFSCYVNASPVIRNNNQQTSQDSCFHPYGLQVFVWEDSSGGCRYSVMDTNTGQQVVTNALITTTSSQPKCFAVNSLVIVTFFDTTTNHIRYFQFSAVTPTSPSAISDLVTDNANPLVYDGTVINNRIFFTYVNNAGGISTIYININNFTIVEYKISGETANSISLFQDTSNNVWVVYYTGTQVKAFIATFMLVAVLGPTIIETVSNVKRVTGCYDSTRTLGQIYYDISASQNSNYLVRQNTLTVGGTVGSASVLNRSIAIVSKAFFYNGNAMFLAGFDSPLQPTYFVINQSASVIAKISPQTAGGVPSKSLVANVNTISSGVFQISYLQKDFATVTNGQIYFQLGVMQSTLDFTRTSTNSIDIGNNLHVTGGILEMYDGAQVVEHGFNIYPEQITDTFQTIGGGLNPQQYQYAITYEWTDNYGQIHRSNPSVPVTVNLNPATAQTGFNFTGDTTNASKVLSNMSSIANIAIGSQITGPNIPATTYVAGIITNTSILLTNAATNDGVAQTFVNTPIFIFPASTSNGSTSMTVGGIQYLNVVGTWSSTTMTVTNATGLSGYSGSVGVGQLFSTASGDFPANTIITAVSGTTITLNHPPTTTKTNTIAVLTQTFTGSASMGGSTITGVDAAFINQYLTPGQTISIHGVFPAVKHTIQSLGTNTVTITDTWESNGSTFDAYFPATDQLVIGQTILDTNAGATILPNTTIKSISGSVITLSAPATATQTNANFTTSDVFGVSLIIPTLRITAKSFVTIGIYRTQGNGTTFFLVSSVKTPLFNDKTVDTVSFYDGTADTQIIGNAQLYTTSGEVGNFPVPVCQSVSIYRNRAIAIPTETPNQFWYSKQVIPGVPVEFSDLFTQNVDQRGGDLVVSSPMDDKLILFKDKQIYYMVGDGPSPNGSNNDFSEPQLITTDVGCDPNSIRSVVVMPLGLMFKSLKGIYLLDRSLQTSYIGAEMEAFNSFNVTSSALMADHNQVRFTLTNGTCLAYDYFKAQWSVFTNINAIDSCVFQNLHAFTTSSGVIKQETPNVFNDDGEFISMKLITGWLSFAQLLGFQRVWRMLVLGDYVSPHKLNIAFAKDFNPYIIQQEDADAGSLANSDIYGSGTPYGNDTPYGGVFSNNMWRVRLNNQKTTSIQVTIQDSPEAGFGESLSISGIAFEVGLKKGLNKLGPKSTFG